MKTDLNDPTAGRLRSRRVRRSRSLERLEG